MHSLKPSSLAVKRTACAFYQEIKYSVIVVHNLSLTPMLGFSRVYEPSQGDTCLGITSTPT